MGHRYLASTLQHCQIRNVYLFMLKLEMSCAGKSNENSEINYNLYNICLFLQRDINRLEFPGNNGLMSSLEASNFLCQSWRCLGPHCFHTLRRGDFASRSSQRPSCLPRVLTFIMWPPIVLPTPFQHSRNRPISHTRKMTTLFNTIRASIYGARCLCLHVYPLLNETDRLCCTFYSHLSSDGGTF